MSLMRFFSGFRFVSRGSFRTLGGPGSGNHGHAGVPGQVGGSAPGSGSSDDATGRADRPKWRVGITSHRPGMDKSIAKGVIQSFQKDMQQIKGVEHFTSEIGRGAFEGGHEPTWVTSYDGNGQAFKKCVEYGQKYEQDGVLFMKDSTEDDPEALPVSFLDFEFDKNAPKELIDAVEKDLLDNGIGYWTWTHTGGGKARIMIAAVKEFSGTRETYVKQIAALRKGFDSHGLGTSETVEWRINHVVFNKGKEQPGSLTYDDVLKDGKTPFKSLREKQTGHFLIISGSTRTWNSQTSRKTFSSSDGRYGRFLTTRNGAKQQGSMSKGLTSASSRSSGPDGRISSPSTRPSLHPRLLNSRSSIFFDKVAAEVKKAPAGTKLIGLPWDAGDQDYGAEVYRKR